MYRNVFAHSSLNARGNFNDAQNARFTSFYQILKLKNISACFRIFRGD